MAMQLSINKSGTEPGRRSERGQEVRLRGEIVMRVVAQMAMMVGHLRGVARQAVRRIKLARTHGGAGKQMKLVESLALGNRRQLLLVVCDNQRYLVGAGADSVGSILALETGAVSRDHAARGPELVKRRGRDANHKAAEPRPDLWH